MGRYLFLLVVISSIVFTACEDGSTIENENSLNKTLESNEGIDNKESSEEEMAEIGGLSDIEGILWASKGSKIGLILAHGAIYDANSWQAQGQEFAQENMVAFAVENTNKDVLISAGNRLKDELGLDKVILVGASAGGASSIKAVIEDETPFDKVILLSPVGDATEIQDLPVLVIYSEQEGYAALEESRPSHIITLAIPGSAHAQALFKEEDKAGIVMEAMIEFIKD